MNFSKDEMESFPLYLQANIAEGHDTWLLPERMYLVHLSGNHIPKVGRGRLLDLLVDIRWWHLLADHDRMTCQGQDRCCRYTLSTAYLETATGTAECNLGIHHLQIVFPIMPCLVVTSANMHTKPNLINLLLPIKAWVLSRIGLSKEKRSMISALYLMKSS